MANRSYLYSCNVIPGDNVEGEKLIGISEWDYDIPLIFKILVSCNTQACKSSIWEFDDKIALVADYDSGVKELNVFLNSLEQIDSELTRKLVSEAMSFLSDEANKQSYFVLECGEIFEMNDADLAIQNLELLSEVNNLSNSISEALACVEHLKPQRLNFFNRLFSKKQEKMEKAYLEAVSSLGLGNWSNTLCYDLSKE